jgi:hypothetical protein
MLPVVFTLIAMLALLWVAALSDHPVAQWLHFSMEQCRIATPDQSFFIEAKK